MTFESEIKVAVITGASSGIGLALSQHLLSKSSPRWFIVQADLNAPPPSVKLPSDRTKYIRTNVAEWESQAECFQKAFNWHRRLDFIALNAGIDDRDDIFSSIDISLKQPDGPRKPNMATFEVDLLGVYYGLKLAAHYLSASESSVKDPNIERGNIVVTASKAALYPTPGLPIYSACKEALTSLTRSYAPTAARSGIRINALCPAVVPTGLAPPGLLDLVPLSHITPMSTILRAYDEMIGSGLPVNQKRTGGVVECSLDKIFWRENDGWKQHPDDTGFLSEDVMEKWGNLYLERNRKWAMTD